MINSNAAIPARRPKLWIFIGLLVCLVALGVAFLLGAYAYKNRGLLMSFFQGAGEYEYVSTSLYEIEIDKIPSPAKGRAGGIAALENGILLADGKGALWFVDSEQSMQALSLRIPINRDTFDNDKDNVDVPYKDRFSVKDILVREFDNQLMLVAAHNQWDGINDCYNLRVSATPTSYAALEGQSDDVLHDWRTLFDSVPCLPLSSVSGSMSRQPTIGGGGRLIRKSDSEILLTVGDFGSYKRGRASLPQKLDNSYGKTILIDIESGISRIFSFGHRNAQGLVITADSRVWMTEHGPQGGDELNVVLDGRNYGFPYVTYGTEYGTSNWPLNERQGAHIAYEKPIFSWVPSVAPSQLISIEKDMFSLWKGDLVISSLRGRSLYRARIEDERIILVEPFEIGHRIRDIIESPDGRIVLKTDDSRLIYIRPVNLKDFDDYEPSIRGKFLATQCQGCHTFDQGGASGIGPNLFDVSNRPVASLDGFEYSPALKAVGGRWTAEELGRFLESPNSFAPGTSMQVNTSFTADQISSLVAYLETLQ